MTNKVDKVDIDTQTKDYNAQQLLEYALKKFCGEIAFASSFGAEDQILIDMLCKINKDVRIFTLDTGRLPDETYELIEITRKKYGIEIEILFPDYKEIEQMVNKYGPNLFYRDIESRKLCCEIRKIRPLKRALAGLDAWICGLRAEQSSTRAGLQRIALDENFGLIKVCPLADWTAEQVWDYIRENDVPCNKLHDNGYPSIGCAPCTRAIKPGEDIRAGRWWWEEPKYKECGLHLNAAKRHFDNGKVEKGGGI